ncbi:MAG: hypothetical protein JST79_16135 [Acidobacteria bacterium]|jgi:hypothetical protein|nr:hypothetical protein [Acidobacteriota bacterium]
MHGWLVDKARREAYFHGHPFHAMFVTLASVVLIVLLVLLLVPAVK